MGISRTFQNIRLFHDLTVLQNVMVGRHCRTRTGLIGAAFKTPSARREEAEIRERAMEYLDSVGLTVSLTSGPAACPTASSGGWRSPGPLLRSPG